MRSMPSTCTFPTATSSSVAPVAALAAAPLPDPIAPPRARFRRLVVFDGRIA
jgi:hypothetical protein